MGLYGQAKLPQLPDIDTEEQPDCLVVEPLVGSIPSMTFDPGTIESEVQQVLDELWNENLVPFALSVGKLTKERDGYTIHRGTKRRCQAYVVMLVAQGVVQQFSERHARNIRRTQCEHELSPAPPLLGSLACVTQLAER